MTNNDEYIISHWSLGSLFSVQSAEVGAIHRTLLFNTSTGRYVLRAYRHQDRGRIEREHALIAYVKARGLPAVGPIQLPSGETILEYRKHYYAVLPYAPGIQVPQSQLTPAHLTGMGAFLAQLHKVLKDYPPEAVTQLSFRLSRSRTLTRITRLQRLLQARELRTDQDKAVLLHLTEQRTWLQQWIPKGESTFTMEEAQVVHGDFQDTNVFFAGVQVSAIIDWDQAYVASRAWEIMRALDLVCSLNRELSQAFLQGYRTHATILLASLDEAATVYGLACAHDVWAYEEFYLEGNDRVLRFLKSGRFVPFAERWAAIRAELDG